MQLDCTLTQFATNYDNIIITKFIHHEMVKQ